MIGRAGGETHHRYNHCAQKSSGLHDENKECAPHAVTLHLSTNHTHSVTRTAIHFDHFQK
jgi:hypothetical protein